ncbi:hypothetical protein GOP56_18755 [Brevibacillus sp. 7WMA2]|uniref:hypothetical protein n=1 Tax=Brevibacillus sp. 7WMA2 TaxID=2683193 RepID=UPI0013A72B27|nr:hypothetical protein [Brevibacillus sp. 7WMA2]QIC07440.1 hypothetical protein GOP56_18755 [Brevibacillus sp. 7WMA2]WPS88342.1 hypothetical protein SMD22_05035 [Brevibacillus halotolerans]
MPSQDEQMILEELNHFPNQILSWERKQVIVENIRKERRMMQKQKRRNAYLGWAAKGLITCAALFAFIWMKPFSSSVETSSSIDTSGNKDVIEQKYITAAQTEIKKAFGINKDFHFEKLDKDTDSYRLETEDRESMVWFKAGTTEVTAVTAKYNIDELPNIYQQYVETARNRIKETNLHDNFRMVHLYKNKSGTGMTLMSEVNQSISVDLNTNKVTHYSLDYNLGNVDKKYVSIAQKALMKLSNKNDFSFNHAKKSSDEKEDMWTFSNKEDKYYDKYSVQIGAKTGQVYNVYYRTDRYSIKSINEAMSVGKPLIKNITGIDVTGYKVDGGDHWGGYVFQSPGKPAVSIFTDRAIDRADGGNVSGIQVHVR